MTEKAIEILEIHPINKGAVQARIKIFIPKWDMEINNIMVFQNEKGAWISMPSREFENEEKKKCFAPFIKFGKPETKERFQKAIMEEYRLRSAEQPAPQSSNETLDLF